MSRSFSPGCFSMRTAPPTYTFISPTSIGALAGLMLVPFNCKSPGIAIPSPRSSASKMAGKVGIVGSGPADSAGEISVGGVEDALPAVARGRALQHVGNVDGAGLHLNAPFDLRGADGAGNVNVGVELQVRRLVRHHLDVVRLYLDVDRADGALVHGEAATDGHRLLVLVEDAELVDRHLIRLEIDAGVEPRKGRSHIRRRERAALDIDRAIKVRVVAGAGNREGRLQRAGNVGDIRRKALHHAKIDL